MSRLSPFPTFDDEYHAAREIYVASGADTGEVKGDFLFYGYKAPKLADWEAHYTKHLDEALGAASLVPNDDRVRLAFALPWMWKLEIYKAWERRPDQASPDLLEFELHKHTKERFGEFLESNIKKLLLFDKALGVLGDFCVLDLANDPTIYELDGSELEDNTTTYRLGASELCSALDSGKSTWKEIDTVTAVTRLEELGYKELWGLEARAPWRRLIFCQGLSSVSMINRQTGADFTICPYLVFSNDDEANLFQEAVKSHLSCSRRLGSESSNPYVDLYKAFHVTFYEIVEGPQELEKWKTGYLYENSASLTKKSKAFRESAFTCLAASENLSVQQRPIASPYRHMSSPFWTVLILSPSQLFSHPGDDATSQGRKVNVNWYEMGKASNKLLVELQCIIHGLRGITERWVELNDYIAGLLTEDFMDPNAYVRLLSDDFTFSRSRRYFWVIGCLNEFDASLSDNIKQWDLYRGARVLPWLDHSDLKKPPTESQDSQATPYAKQLTAQEYDHLQTWLPRLHNLDDELAKIRATMEDSRLQFKTKVDTVRALRDGLFSATALIESRSSTRLAQHVQLLTFVGVFYLPLMFCAALWTVPHITESQTKKSFGTTSVVLAFITYIVVFNLLGFSRLLGISYHHWRSKLVESMQNDSDAWRERGHKLDSIRPDQEVTSEWWIGLYQLCLWRMKMYRLSVKSTRLEPLLVLLVNGFRFLTRCTHLDQLLASLKGGYQTVAQPIQRITTNQRKTVMKANNVPSNLVSPFAAILTELNRPEPQQDAVIEIRDRLPATAPTEQLDAVLSRASRSETAFQTKLGAAERLDSKSNSGK
ncbi:MAG: hypothetical protein MMC33_002288 [Icmadophila ericetorum]|nr:hypothetical protein [Icmadophila ericetorum]